MQAHTRTQTRTRTHAHTHTHQHKHTSTRTPEATQTQSTQAHKHMRAPTRKHTSMSVCRQGHEHKCKEYKPPPGAQLLPSLLCHPHSPPPPCPFRRTLPSLPPCEALVASLHSMIEHQCDMALWAGVHKPREHWSEETLATPSRLRICLAPSTLHDDARNGCSMTLEQTESLTPL